jgi:hypothetical protein
MFARSARALIGLSLLLLGGCATFSDSFGVIEHNLAQNQPLAALAALEKQGHGRGDEVLYLLNKGMLLRQVRDYAGSNAAFAAARERIDALYGASVTEQAASFLINDGTRAYTGEAYEQVMLHVYMALNYLELGQPQDARVEALQVDLLLRQQAERLPETRYSTDALARYLTGKIYESLGEWSDAMIAYRKAYEAYGRYAKTGAPMPRFLGPDLVRLAKRLGLSQELAKYQREFGLNGVGANNGGEIVFLLHAGLAPIKREESSMLVSPKTGRLVRVSLPRYEPRAPGAWQARISVDDKTATTEMAQDIGFIAISELEAKLPAITARALARAVIKDATVEEAAKRNNLVGLAMNVANVLTERADTRSWLTLPGHIHLATLSLPPGTYTVKADIVGAGGTLATREFADVTVRAGKKAFLSYHWVPLSLTASGDHQ